MEKILEIKNLSGGYGSIQILNGINLNVYKNEFVTIIGPNGCGKSTFLKVIFGIANYYDGEINYKNNNIKGLRADTLVKKGIGYVPQVDNVFPSLSVQENLQMGGIKLTKKRVANGIERSFEMFPDLKPRINDLAVSLSGGERQMLAIARALISEPTFLMLDEPTAALSPRYQQEILTNIDELRGQGISVLLVEQNARLSLAKSDRGYIFSGGRIIHSGNAKTILDDPNIGKYFLGIPR